MKRNWWPGAEEELVEEELVGVEEELVAWSRRGTGGLEQKGNWWKRNWWPGAEEELK